MIDEFNKFILVSAFGEGLPLAHHLKMEGKEVMTVMVDDLKDIGEKKSEDKDSKRARLSQYDGMLDKITPEKMFTQMEKMDDKEDWFVIFDFNTLWRQADKALGIGFVNGLFPSQLDYQLEADREFAKRAVVKNYAGVKVAEVNEFKQIDEGIEFLNDSDEFWALKGNDAAATTLVPRSKNLEHVKSSIIFQLQSHKEDYERKGFIFERQIRDGLESCPQMIYYDGKRVASSVDYEDKAISSTDDSEMMGCAINIIQSTPPECLLNGVAFPDFADKLAAKHKGLFYIDFNNIQKDGEYYYLEYCSGRMGYDAVFAECDMASSVSEYFNKIAHGENPYKRKYGAGVRGFTMKRGEKGEIKDDITLNFDSEIEEHIWPFSIKQGDGRHSNTKGAWGDIYTGIDLLAFTASSDDLVYSEIKLDDHVSQFSYNGLYARNDIRSLNERIDALEKFTTPIEVGMGKK